MAVCTQLALRHETFTCLRCRSLLGIISVRTEVLNYEREPWNHEDTLLILTVPSITWYINA